MSSGKSDRNESELQYSVTEEVKSIGMLNGFKHTHSRVSTDPQEVLRPQFKVTSMQLPTPITSQVHVITTPLNLLNNHAYYTASHLQQSEDEILRLRSQNIGILQDLKQLTSKYNQTCQAGMRAARVVLQPSSDREPSIEQAVNISHVMEINALLRSQNSNLQQNNHLLRLLLAERERQLTEVGYQPHLKAEIEALNHMIERLQRQLADEKCQSDVSILDARRLQDRAVEERLLEKEKQLQIVKDCLIQQKIIASRLKNQLTKLNGELNEHNFMMVKGRKSYSRQQCSHIEFESSRQEMTRVVSQMEKMNNLVHQLRIQLASRQELIGKLQQEKASLQSQAKIKEDEYKKCKAQWEEDRKMVIEGYEQRLQVCQQQCIFQKSNIQRLENESRENLSQIEKRDRNLENCLKTVQESHSYRTKSLELEVEIQRLREDNQKLKDMNQIMGNKIMGPQSQGSVDQLWRQKSNQYILLSQQLNSYRSLCKLALLQ